MPENLSLNIDVARGLRDSSLFDEAAQQLNIAQQYHPQNLSILILEFY